MKSKSQIKIEEKINELVECRGWEKYHVPSHLIMSLSAECAELMQFCLWETPEKINSMFRNKDERLVKELADIAINYYAILRYCDIDVEEIVESKVNELMERYKELKKGEHR